MTGLLIDNLTDRSAACQRAAAEVRGRYGTDNPSDELLLRRSAAVLRKWTRPFFPFHWIAALQTLVWSGSLPGIVLLAIAYTLLNSLKPLHVDDTAYYYYAAEVAKRPLDPYGFEIFWYQSPQPAFQVLAPPVLPYWWSCAIRLFGDQPFLWKLWLFPFSLLLVFALHGLSHRFATGFEGPLVWVTVLSPTFLPSLNMMLDVPCLALRMFGLLVFLRACDRDSPRLAVMAGMITGLAMETKYTGFLGSITILFYAALFRRTMLGLVAGMGAAFVFGAWEGVTAWGYGESHFLYHWWHSRPTPPMEEMITSLCCMLGGLTPYVTLYSLVALKLPAFAVKVSAFLMVVPYVLLGLMSEQDLPITFADIFDILGLVQSVTLLIVAGRILYNSINILTLPRSLGNLRIGCFLLGWMILELAGYFILTPFPAVRRVMGIVVLATLLVGRLVSTTCQAPDRRLLLHKITFIGIGVGLLFFVVDYLEANAEKRVVERMGELPQGNPNRTVWFVGHWGFQFYAEHARMRQAVSGHSTLRRGDWLAVPDRTIDQQRIDIDSTAVRLLHRVTIDDYVPLRTLPGFYDSGSSLFISHRQDPRLTLQIYEVTTDFTP